MGDFERMKILFICRHNCFRSRIAEEYMKQHSKHEIDSAGLIPSTDGPLPVQIAVAKTYGIDIENKAKGITASFLNSFDIIVNTADDIPISLLQHKSYNKAELIGWNIPDVDEAKPLGGQCMAIIERIIKYCDNLEIELGKN